MITYTKLRTQPFSSRPTASLIYWTSLGANWIVSLQRSWWSCHWFLSLDSEVKKQVLGSAHFSLYIDDLTPRVSTHSTLHFYYVHTYCTLWRYQHRWAPDFVNKLNFKAKHNRLSLFSNIDQRINKYAFNEQAFLNPFKLLQKISTLKKFLLLTVKK